MKQSTLRQSIVRLAAIVALATGLVLSSGITAAAPLEVGLTACYPDACAVITIDELKAAQAERGLTIYRPTSFTADRLSPHLIPYTTTPLPSVPTTHSSPGGWVVVVEDGALLLRTAHV